MGLFFLIPVLSESCGQNNWFSFVEQRLACLQGCICEITFLSIVTCLWCIKRGILKGLLPLQCFFLPQSCVKTLVCRANTLLCVLHTIHMSSLHFVLSWLFFTSTFSFSFLSLQLLCPSLSPLSLNTVSHSYFFPSPSCPTRSHGHDSVGG